MNNFDESKHPRDNDGKFTDGGGGGGKIYSQEIPLEDVAWINGDEGQYAKIL